MKKIPAFVVYIGVALAALAVLFMGVFWMLPLHEATDAFKQPKIVGIHLEGEPFVRIKLKPGWHLRPVEIMYGTNALVTCEVVRAPLGQKYEAKMMGQVKKSKDCRFRFKVTDKIGTKGEVTVTYRFKTKKGWGSDSFTVPYRIIPGGKFIRIYTLEDANHKPTKGIYCPTRQVYIYGTAALPVVAKGLVPLFFVEDPLSPGPVLQVRPDSGGVKPIAGKVVEFRRYGDKLHGLAFWNLEPASVGPQQPNGAVYNIYAGLFREKDVPGVVKSCIRVLASGGNSVRIQSRLRSIDELRRVAVAMTKPWRVIRAKNLKAKSAPHPRD